MTIVATPEAVRELDALLTDLDRLTASGRGITRARWTANALRQEPVQVVLCTCDGCLGLLALRAARDSATAAGVCQPCLPRPQRPAEPSGCPCATCAAERTQRASLVQEARAASLESYRRRCTVSCPRTWR